MKSKTVAALAVFAALLITAVAGVALTPAAAAAAPGVITLAGAPGVVGTTDGTGTAARFSYARGVTVDGSGNVYVADTNASVIRKITAAGVVTTLAGLANTLGSANGTGATARFNYPEGITCDVAGNIYVADTQNNMIRRITPAGVVTTVAGQLGVGGFGGWVDGSTAIAMFTHPRGIVLDAAGNIYVGDSGNDAVRKITPAGVVSTMAGGVGVFNNPRGLAVDANGILYVADFSNHRIARVSAAGVVTTFAGSTTAVAGSANGTGTAARFSNPDGVVRDSSGNIYVADSGNNTIRRMASGGAVVTTYAGAAGIAGSADGIFTAARFNDPRGLGVDTAGNVYIADRGNSTIRKTIANMFTITATAGANGTITPAGVIGVAVAGSVTFTITPNTGYHVANVLVDGVSVGALTTRTFTAVSANHTISATFAINTFTLTPSAGAGGSISPATVQTVNYGGSQTFTMTANVGFRVATVLVDGTNVPASVTSGSYTFTSVAANHTIAVTFGPSSFVITPSSGANGSIAPAIATTVPAGGSQTFTMTANAGFQVGNVLVDGASVGAVASYQFTNVLAAHTISVTFVAATYTITPSAGANGTISPATVQTVTINGSSPAFVMTPATGYHIADVLIDGLTNPGAIAAGTFTFTSVIANHTIAVSFAINTFTILPSAGPNGTITPGTATTVNNGGSQTFTIGANAGYHIVSVLVDGVSVGTVGSYTFTNVIANHTIWATFETNAPAIAVTAPVGTGIYAQNSSVTSAWTASPAVATGEFGVFAVSSAGNWYGGYLVPATGASSYTFGFPLAVPAGVGYSMVVEYRPTAGSGAWTTGGSSPGTFDVTGPATAVSVTAPTGTGSYARNSLVTVAWTASPAVGVGEFGVFAVSSAGNWYGGYLVSATGIGSYTFDFPLAVPVGTGYVIVVEYRPTAGSGAWATGASSPGTFAVN